MKLNDRMAVAKVFADTLFRDKGKMYDGQPYVVHLQAVVDILLRYDVTDKDMLTAAYLHDIIEDVHVEYQTIVDLFGTNVAVLVDGVTDATGIDRKDRKMATYPKTRSVPGATLLKLADRIANIEHGLATNNERQFKMYRKEHVDFVSNLREIGKLDDMWDHLAALIAIGVKQFTKK